jgi:hypothetical protein
MFTINNMVDCEFCYKKFSTISNLYAHQRNTKSCLEKQTILKQKASKKKEETHKCESCDKKFQSISNLNKHKKICIDYIITNVTNNLTDVYEKREKQLIENYEKRIEEYIKLITSKDEQLNKKDETIERVMKTLASKTTTINNNSIFYNNINFNKIPPITKQFLLDKSNLLNYNYMDVEKMGGFIAKHLMENAFVTDTARRKVVFVNSNNIPVTNYTIEKLLYVVLSPIEHKLATIANEALEKYAKNKPECDEIKKLNTALQNIAKNCELSSKSNKIRGQIITSICKTAKGKHQLLEFTDEKESNDDTIVETDNNNNIKINDVETDNNSIKTIEESNTKTTTEYVKKFNNKEIEYVYVRLEKGVWIDKHNNRYDESCFIEEESGSESDEKVI